MSPISIVCDFNLGTNLQPVYVCDSEHQTVNKVAEVEFDFLPLELVKICRNQGTDFLHLYGATEILIGLAEAIKSIAATEYYNNNLNIEIN